ncbi:MAG: Fic family protein [Candidatus Nanopelagicales bacterium]
MSPIEYLGLEDLLLLVRVLETGPVRDVGLLQGCAQRPAASAFGQDAYPDLATKAAAMLHSVARTHPLVDGNKRLAWLATAVFLDINGQATGVSDADAFSLVMDVAAGDVDLADIARRLRVTPALIGSRG